MLHYLITLYDNVNQQKLALTWIMEEKMRRVMDAINTRLHCVERKTMLRLTQQNYAAYVKEAKVS